MDGTALFIVPDTVLDQIAHGPADQIPVHMDRTEGQGFFCLPDNGMSALRIQVHEVHHHLPCDGHQVFWLGMDGLHIVFQPGSQIQVLDQVSHTLALTDYDSGFLADLAGKLCVIPQLCGISHHHGQGGTDVMGHPCDPVCPCGIPFAKLPLLGLQDFRGPVDGKGQFGQQSGFPDIYRFFCGQGLYAADDGLYGSQQSGIGSDIDQADQDEIEGQDQKEVPGKVGNEVIVPAWPHVFPEAVLWVAQHHKVIPGPSRKSGIVMDIPLGQAGDVRNGIGQGHAFGQRICMPDDLQGGIVNEDSPDLVQLQFLGQILGQVVAGVVLL